MASLGLSGCAVSGTGQQVPSKWTTGFWFWQGSSSRDRWSGAPLDVLFVQVGANHGESLPEHLPEAREYWLVYRYGKQGTPPLQAAPQLAAELSSLWAAGRKRHLNVAGIQLDIDSPTGALPQYATFLREVRKGLPAGCEVSITALLDWFRTGTAVEAVIREVDEFVPQFYDIDAREYQEAAAIAARIDAAGWGPVFNRFRKRFRLGISTFGRARMVPAATYYGDVKPIEIATNPAFHLEVTRNAASELVLNYRTARKIRIGYTEFKPGDAIQFILATPETVRTAVESARQIKGYIAGVLLFRWPSEQEALTMQPDEALRAAGASYGERGARSRIAAIRGHCAAVECVDLYLSGGDPFAAKPIEYHIRASSELEYFLPEKGLPIRMTAPAELTFQLSPYCGRGRLYLGRAVSAASAEFKVEEEQ